ncbi:MAG: Zn-ribbon domain-containing OB-fold protein [Burkholderiaceae bacterium]
MNAAARPSPSPTQVTLPFWEAAAKGTLLFQRCSDCKRTQSLPRLFCSHCMSEDVKWETSQGLGTVYTFTVNHRAANAHMADKVPYVVALVELDEGVRMMANIVDVAPETVRIGDRMQVQFLRLSDTISLPQFAPASTA